MKKSDWTPTHLEKIYWPRARYTKRDLIFYYRAVARFALPYLKNRPVVLKRFPEGITGQSFFQKNVVDARLPPFVKLVAIPAKTIRKRIHYVVCNNEETLLYLANLGAIELHPWSSQTTHLKKPDEMIFDLDPGKDAAFRECVQVALHLKRVLHAIGAKSYVKTSGKRGLHVYVPLQTRYSYETVRRVARDIAEVVATQMPRLATLEVHPNKRKNKIFIDYLRNAFGQTAVAPYSPRATDSASVSTPLRWSEVKLGLRPDAFTVKTLPRRLKRVGDVWKGMFRNGADVRHLQKGLAAISQRR